MSEKITKEVEIDIRVNGINYSGTVIVTQDNYDSDPSFDFGGMEVPESLNAYCDGCYIGKVKRLLEWEAMYQADIGDMKTCIVTGYHVDVNDDDIVYLETDEEYCFEVFAYYFEPWEEWVLASETDERRVSFTGESEYFTAPLSYWDDLYYCEDCDCYVRPEYWNNEYACCRWCAEEKESSRIIEDYTVSHNHEPIFFGDYDSEEDFAGIGFELEVDCNSSNSYKNEAVAANLCYEAGLDNDEMRFAHDGSLNYGFECISQPHTVKDFWDKQEKWSKMLKYLASEGYRSHDTSTCGLHVHVSRKMFGKDKDTQDIAISKVYTFFDENWDDLVKVSRRKCFSYCDKNKLNQDDYVEVDNGYATKYDKWKHKSKYERGHYVALNNGNRTTFEYRLGRGTLNPWSFFSWIDLIVTITKNARRITVTKVNSNDLVSWLGGIKETTARYIYKRGAFKDTMVALFPSIEWEHSTVDNTDNE